MAWTAPRTWVAGEMATAALLNTHLRDNLLALDQHTHIGSAGDGSAVLTSISRIEMATASTATATGTLIRNGTDLFWGNGSTAINITLIGAAAGTASLRALGTANGTQAAPGDHGH